jgi:hypothetical protein
MGERYGTRPSAILNLRDEWAAYQVDLAAMWLGREVETAQANGESIDAILEVGKAPSAPNQPARPAQQYADPRGKFPILKMKIPPSGVW